MEFWNNIVNSALLGTSKKPLNADELSAVLKEASSGISVLALDPEDKFLHLASLAFNYRQCGVMAIKKESLQNDIASPEENAYCTAAMIQTLRDILHEGNEGLLENWLQLCEASHRIVSPELIPALFSLAEKNKSLRTLIIQCCGKRGEWLSHFNPDWNFYLLDSTEDLWQTGSLEQRKGILKTLRKTEPAKARELLQQVWSQENAATKLELLKGLSENLSLEDEQWLQSLLKEKSSKLKEEVFSLLRQLPDSFLVNAYQQVITQSLFIKKGKALLGLVNKISIELKMPAQIQETVLASGIDKLSNTKGVSDEEYIVTQLLNFIPPSFLEKQYEVTAGEIIDAFWKEKVGRNFLPALASAVGTYKDKAWASAFASNSNELYADLVFLLPQKELETYLMKNFTQYPNDSVRLASQTEGEWSVDFSIFILKHTSGNLYQYNRHFYNQLISVLPVKVKDDLKKITVEELQRPAWENIRDHIYNLVLIKEQIIQSFNKL